MGTTLDNVPNAVPYLAAQAQRLAWWREQLGPRRRRWRVGVVCSGNPRHGNDHNRSIGLEQLAVLGELDAEVHLLQSELREADLPWLQRLGWIDHRARLTDFAETAALVQCMDAVVSVDTAVAHLAGALGRPLFLLLPAIPDWRWLLDRADSPWYPSARLFRQQRPGQWEQPLRLLGQALRAHLEAEAGDERR